MVKKRGIIPLLVFGLLIRPWVSLSQEEELSLKITAKQLEDLKLQPEVRFSKTAPVLEEGEMLLCIDEKLGGGYIAGTPDAISAALYNVGIRGPGGMPIDPMLLAKMKTVTLIPFPMHWLGIVAPIGGLIGVGAYILAAPPEEEAITPTHH
jgi:hypothetical protein